MFGVVLFLLSFLSIQSTQAQVTCALCDFAIDGVEKFLAENATEQEIENFLGHICDFLPSGDQQSCHDEVTNDLPVIINYIETKENPQVVCALLHLCTSVQVKQSFECTVCEVLINSVEQYVAGGETEAEIIANLDKICADFPGSLNTTCAVVVQQYVPAAIQWIENEENPDEFCSQVGLCTADKKSGRILTATDRTYCDMFGHRIMVCEDPMSPMQTFDAPPPPRACLYIAPGIAVNYAAPVVLW
jgi:hypothetical protein